MTSEEVAALSKEEWTDALLDCLTRISEATSHRVNVRNKPVLGGVFGAGGYLICSWHGIDRELDCVVFYVKHTGTGFILGTGDDQSEAIRAARSALTNIDGIKLQIRMQRFLDWHNAEKARREQERQEALERHRAEIRANATAQVKSIPRRRKQIFEEAEGKCHYCSTPLTLDGKWHIEHKMPKALGGDNQPANLVASCVSCNHKKRDTTDVEFKARLAKEAA